MILVLKGEADVEEKEMPESAVEDDPTHEAECTPPAMEESDDTATETTETDDEGEEDYGLEEQVVEDVDISTAHVSRAGEDESEEDSGSQENDRVDQNEASLEGFSLRSISDLDKKTL